MQSEYNSILEKLKEQETKEKKVYPVRLYPTFRKALEESLKKINDEHYEEHGTLLNLQPAGFITEIVQQYLMELNPKRFEQFRNELSETSTAN